MIHETDWADQDGCLKQAATWGEECTEAQLPLLAEPIGIYKPPKQGWPTHDAGVHGH